MTAAYGDVPLLDPITGRFPDSFAPPSVAAAVTDAQTARQGAEDALADAVELVGDVTVWDQRVAAAEAAAAAAAAEADALTASVVTKPGTATFDIRDYGAAVDARVLTDVAMTAGSAVLGSAAYSFTASDVGKVIGVSGAGPVSDNYDTNANDGVLVSTIVSVAAGNATLADVAVSTFTGQTCCFGTPDDDAFYDAQQAVVAAGGGRLYIPAGRTIVTRPLAIESRVEWVGAGRDLSWVEVIFSAPDTGSGTTEWLYKTGDRKSNIFLHDFGVEARYHIRPSGYTTSLKPLNIYGVDYAGIWRMHIRNFPATAIPFDHCYFGAVIRDNLIVNPGRLFDGSAGGSGIGIGIVRDGRTVSYTIQGNTILGVGSTSTAPRGNNGIFIEAQSGTGATATGFHITGNHVEGMRRGIAEDGAGQTIIAQNTIVDCFEGVYVGPTPIISGSFAGEDVTIQCNVIRGWCPPVSTTVDKPVGIRIYAQDSDDTGNARALDNIIVDGGGHGIQIIATGTGVLNGIELRGNRIRNTALSGVLVDTAGGGVVGAITIIENDITDVGMSNTAGADSGIRLAAPIARLTMYGNRVSAPNGSAFALVDPVGGGMVAYNDFSSVGITGAIAPGVRIFGNLGWPGSIPTVTGIKSGGTALASLITTLVGLGIINDATS